MSKQTVCVDFDGVLNTYTGWQGEKELFKPRPGAREFLEKLSAKYTVRIHTIRNAVPVRDWLKKHGMIDLVESIGSVKPHAIAYIDDRGVRFEGDYEDALRQVERKPHWQDGYTKMLTVKQVRDLFSDRMERESGK